MRNIFFYISKKILWKISRPVSNFFILTHKISYKDPLGNKPLTNNIQDYDENFANSVELKNHSISKTLVHFTTVYNKRSILDIFSLESLVDIL